MVLQKLRVSQNFSRISRVSQSRFFGRLSASRSLDFFMKPSPASSQKLAKRLKGASRKLRKNHDVLCLNSAARI